MAKVSSKAPGKGPKSGGKSSPKAPRTSRSAPGGEAVPPGPGHNRLTTDEERALFLSHRTAWNEWQAKVKAVEAIGIDVKAALRSDGFTVKQMKIADSLGEVKGEKRITDEVTDRLKVARWIGHPMGAQLDMFEQPDRTPSTDRAFDMGKQASMENAAAKPPFSPETEQYRSYMAGYHEHQGKIGKGFKQTEPAPDADPSKGTEGEAGVRVPRSEFMRSLKERTRAQNGAPVPPAEPPATP